MIPNHASFIDSIRDRKRVLLQFYSTPDNSVLNRVCAPLEYGPGIDLKDVLNRYWIWDYAAQPGSHRIGLVPEQIVKLQISGESFDPTQLSESDSAPGG